MAKGSERQLTALRLRDEGQTYAQIAVYLGVTTSRAHELVKKGRAITSPSSYRLCGDPLYLGDHMIDCQRIHAHTGRHYYKGPCNDTLHAPIITVEWQWSNPQ
jgi:hypothetical protein